MNKFIEEARLENVLNRNLIKVITLKLEWWRNKPKLLWWIYDNTIKILSYHILRNIISIIICNLYFMKMYKNLKIYLEDQET